MKPAHLRIIDANLNRSCEGLRVCEDILRFYLNDKALTGAFKSLRHRLNALSKKVCSRYDRLSARRAKTDVGRKSTKSEVRRKGFLDIFSANIQRAEESLRVLEEISKLTNENIPSQFKRLRFKLYELDKISTLKLKDRTD